MENGFADIGGFRTWPQAVNWLLHTYVTDLVLDASLEKLENLTQQPTETVRQFHSRLISAAKDLGDAFTQQELLSKLSRGLLPTIRPAARLFRMQCTGPNALDDFARRCDAIHEQNTAIAKSIRGKEVNFVLDAESHSRKLKKGYHPVSEMPSHRHLKEARVDRINLATASTREKGSSSSSDNDSNASSDFLSAMDEADSILLSSMAAASRFGTAVPPRPSPAGWGSSDAKRRDARRGSLRDMMIPIICYLCMGENHIISQCPHKEHANDPRFLDFFRDNFAKLHVWKQEYMRHMNKVWFESPGSTEGVATPRHSIHAPHALQTPRLPPPAAMTSASSQPPTTPTPPVKVIQRPKN